MVENAIIDVYEVECPICFLDTSSESFSVFPCCDYLICENCRNEWGKRSMRCPNCRTILATTTTRSRNDTEVEVIHCKKALCVLSPLILILTGWIIYNVRT